MLQRDPVGLLPGLLGPSVPGDGLLGKAKAVIGAQYTVGRSYHGICDRLLELMLML
jgi:hypothetical protein